MLVYESAVMTVNSRELYSAKIQLKAAMQGASVLSAFRLSVRQYRIEMFNPSTGQLEWLIGSARPSAFACIVFALPFTTLPARPGDV